ncbi:MAG: AEC family transporter [Promethearchaeota archaeon]
MADVNYIFLLSLAIIVIGYIVKKLNIITEENGKVIAKIIFNITLPAVILKITSVIEFDPTLIFLPLITISFSLIMAIIGMIIFRNYSKTTKGLMLMAIIGFNIANFAFPLIEGIYGQEGLQYIALVDAGNAFSIFVVCYIIASIFSPIIQAEDKKKIDIKYIAKQLITSAPLMSYVIALSINLSGLDMPIFVIDLLDILARANTALILLLLGIYLSFKFEKKEWNIILKVLVIRYSFGITIGLLLFFFLPANQFNPLFRVIIAVSLILPIGMAVIPFSVEFEYNEKLMSMMVNLSIIISFILSWFFILLLSG